MKIRQISLFLENRKGRLHDVCSLLGEKRINIRALTIAETDEFGVLRMVVDSPDEAVDVLKEKGFVATVTEIVAVEVDDRPGGLARVLSVVTESGLNIEYMYGFVEKKSDRALMVFRFDDPDKAVKLMKENDVPVIGQQEIKSL